MEEQSAILREIIRLHEKATVLWNERKRFLMSACKSATEAKALGSKTSNPQRRRLKSKLETHITRAIDEYTPSIDEFAAINRRTQAIYRELPSNVDLSEVLLAARLVKQIENIMVEASSFVVS